MFRGIYTTLTLTLLLSTTTHAQVQLRDSVVTWQHHSFELDEDYGMMSFTTDDSDITEVTFAEAKVLENDLIRLVLLPEYGGRVISFYHKPTSHEYFYQSECGSAYGIGDGNFYYDWLMVYGGVFPTFPESEHGKTWLVPWDFSVVEETEEVVTVRMQYTDNTDFSGAPGSFNNGNTGITCAIDVSVYAGASIWDFDVTLTNNKSESVNYEYWTCTTLAPGSDPGRTSTPLNSEMVIPVDNYFAAWSPGAWIGDYNEVSPMSDINYLDEWQNMGIAYADDFDNNHWGVINHDNGEGVFRISENEETPGVKLWTWGRNNVDNNLFDYSNGGADNYIELWAGVSNQFFEDARLSANEQKSWKESYCATVNMTSIDSINQQAAINLILDNTSESGLIEYEINVFHTDPTYEHEIYLTDSDQEIIPVMTEYVGFADLGIVNNIGLPDLSPGNYTVHMVLRDEEGNTVLSTAETLDMVLDVAVTQEENAMSIRVHRFEGLRIEFNNRDSYRLAVFSLNGHKVKELEFTGLSADVSLLDEGLYVVKAISKSSEAFTQKVIFTH